MFVVVVHQFMNFDVLITLFAFDFFNPFRIDWQQNITADWQDIDVLVRMLEQSLCTNYQKIIRKVSIEKKKIQRTKTSNMLAPMLRKLSK